MVTNTSTWEVFLWQLKIVKRNHFGTTNKCFKTPITIQASKKLEWDFVNLRTSDTMKIF
jgi:glutamine amidotransferase PdxT